MVGIKGVLARFRERMMPRPQQFRIRVLSDKPLAWLAAVEPAAPTWSGVPSAARVRLTGRSRTPTLLRFIGGPRELLLPLRERDILAAPRVGWALLPRRAVVQVLRNKALFARRLTELGFGDLLPRHFSSPETAEFPCVLKRVHAAGSSAVTIVRSAEEVAALMALPPFAGRVVLLQELLPTDTDEVAYFVVASGRIVWQTGYNFHLPEPGIIRLPTDQLPVTRFQYGPDDIAFFERLFAALKFSGPVNLDIKRRADGSMAILEINPRLGGSLMRPENVDHLRGVINAIAAHAEWQGSGLVARLLPKRRRRAPAPVPIGEAIRAPAE